MMAKVVLLTVMTGHRRPSRIPQQLLFLHRR